MSEEHNRHFHIALVGNVGTGKSTLARLIQQRIGGTLYLENPEDYIFVRFFFADCRAWGFANELQFLITKTAQQAHIRSQAQLAIQEMDEQATHAIWIPAFSAMGYTTEEETAVLDQAHSILSATPIATPDVRIYLHATVPTVLARIRRRGRDFEALDPSFVQLITILDKHVQQFVHNVPGSMITVDTETVDFTVPSIARDRLLADICGRVPA